MKVSLFTFLLICAAATAQQFNRFRFPFGRQQFRRPQFGGQQFGRQQFGGFRGSDNSIGGNVAVDNTLGGSQYHYSWRHAGFNTKWVYGGANSYCRNLGPGWAPVSINSPQEDSLVRSAIGRERVPYIWTGGQRSGFGWQWADGSRVGYTAWSRTGGARRAQPDNREGNESCLAVLNSFYNDGIVWHDIACHHQKPVICERG